MPGVLVLAEICSRKKKNSMIVHVIVMTSGDVAFRVLERIKSVGHRAMQGALTETEEDTHIYVCDINPNMLNVGKKRAAERGLKHQLCNIFCRLYLKCGLCCSTVDFYFQGIAKNIVLAGYKEMQKL